MTIKHFVDCSQILCQPRSTLILLKLCDSLVVSLPLGKFSKPMHSQWRIQGGGGGESLGLP